MPRVIGPLFSVTAWGAFGKAIVFQRRRGGATVYLYGAPRVPDTAGQLAQKASFASAISAWGALPAASKARYEIQADGTRLSGYLLFLQNYLLGSS